MSKVDMHPKSEIDKENDTDLDRRGIIGKALMILGPSNRIPVSLEIANASRNISAASARRPVSSRTRA